MSNRLYDELEPDVELEEIPEGVSAEEFETGVILQSTAALSNADYAISLGEEDDPEEFDAEYVRTHPAEYGNIDGNIDPLT